jgi:hypothetical protein
MLMLQLLLLPARGGGMHEKCRQAALGSSFERALPALPRRGMRWAVLLAEGAAAAALPWSHPPSSAARGLLPPLLLVLLQSLLLLLCSVAARSKSCCVSA